MVTQLSLVVALAHGAALMLQSYRNVTTVPFGFDTDRVVVAGISLQGLDYRDNAERQADFWYRLVSRVREVPGVEMVGATSKLPLNGGTNGPLLVEGERYDPIIERPTVERSYITPEYFAAAGIPVVAGRSLVEADFGDREYGVVVNQAFERRYWPGQRALGRRVYPNTAVRHWGATIVGVVGDVRQWGMERPPLPEIFYPLGVTTRNVRYLVVRTTATRGSLERAIRAAAASIDPRQAVSAVRTFGDLATSDSSRRRFQTVLIMLFAGAGLAMVLGGVYGLLSYQVTQRTREYGIRLALGADARRLVWAVIWRGSALTSLGCVIGCGLALGASRVIGDLVFGVDPSSPVWLMLVTMLMAMVGVIGAALPARRASRVDPVLALRTE